jgi:hypothetical protein
MDETFRAEVSPVTISQTKTGRYVFKGVASTTGNADRMRRVFLPGAFKGGSRIKVPLLANHDENQVLGSSVLFAKGDKLMHESSINPKAGRADEMISLLEEGDIASTSIQWVTPQGDRYFGWSDLKRKAPDLASYATSMGVVQAEDAMYMASATLVENSIVPIPANDRALIGASALVGEAERGYIDSMREVASMAPQIDHESAAGSRHNATDRASIQTAHDALVNLGATCTVTTADSENFSPGDGDDEADRQKMSESPPLGGWVKALNPRGSLDEAETAELPLVDIAPTPENDNQNSLPLPAEMEDLDRELAALEAVFTA